MFNLFLSSTKIGTSSSSVGGGVSGVLLDVHRHDVLLDVLLPGGGEAAEPAGVVADTLVDALDVLGQVRPETGEGKDWLKTFGVSFITVYRTRILSLHM